VLVKYLRMISRTTYSDNILHLPVALPCNENVDQTLQVLQEVYDIVVQDGINHASLAVMITDVSNGAVATDFTIKACEDTSHLPPTRLLLRRLAILLKVAIIVLSTRSATQMYYPTRASHLHVGILHLANSYEQVVMYSPLTCSSLSPRLTRMLPLKQNPPRTDLARCRVSKRAVQS